MGFTNTISRLLVRILEFHGIPVGVGQVAMPILIMMELHSRWMGG
jgi:hypothetical protein